MEENNNEEIDEVYDEDFDEYEDDFETFEVRTQFSRFLENGDS